MKRIKAKKNRLGAPKLDMTKAYDCVEWEYLEDIIYKLGFATSWVSLIIGFVSSFNFFVMFNGSKLEEFKPSRGLRHRDAISPYMLLLVAKSLPCLLKSRNESLHLVGSRLMNRPISKPSPFYR